jgi:hypothetical protein
MLSIKLKFVEFRLEKHDLDLYMNVSWKKKNPQKLSNFEKFFFQIARFYDQSKCVAKNIEG